MVMPVKYQQKEFADPRFRLSELTLTHGIYFSDLFQAEDKMEGERGIDAPWRFDWAASRWAVTQGDCVY
eukprot:1330128-Amorphochlora_amoeboformis.AAC.1